MAFDPDAWCEAQPGAPARLFERMRTAGPQVAEDRAANGILGALRESPAGARPTMLLEHLRGESRASCVSSRPTSTRTPRSRAWGSTRSWRSS